MLLPPSLMLQLSPPPLVKNQLWHSHHRHQHVTIVTPPSITCKHLGPWTRALQAPQNSPIYTIQSNTLQISGIASFMQTIGLWLHERIHQCWQLQNCHCHKSNTNLLWVAHCHHHQSASTEQTNTNVTDWSNSNIILHNAPLWVIQIVDQTR